MRPRGDWNRREQVIMPSIPQSLLWISLVVLWLFVLVPMLISKRDAVRRTSDVALATRVLNGGAGARLLRRSGPAEGHRSDPDWKPEDSELAGVDQDEYQDGDQDHDTDDAQPPRPVVMKVTEAEHTEPDYLDVDVVEDSGALPAGVGAQETEPMAAVDDRVAAVGEDGRSDEGDETEPVGQEDKEAEHELDDEYEYVEDSSGL